MDPLVAFAVSPTGVVLILLAAIALLIDRRWLAGLAIAAFGAAAIGVAADSLYLDDVHRAAIAEGCRGSPVLVIGALVVGIGLLAVCRLFRR